MTDLEDLINIFKRKLCKDFKSLGIHLKENYISINKKEISVQVISDYLMMVCFNIKFNNNKYLIESYYTTLNKPVLNIRKNSSLSLYLESFIKQ